MEKKQYFSPAMTVVAIQPMQMIAASPGGGDQADPNLINAADPTMDDTDFRQLFDF